jgi:hypothetical protein
MKTSAYLGVALAALGLLACGMDDSSWMPDPSDAGPDRPDGGPSPDAGPPGCDVTFSMQPESPQVGDVVTVSAVIRDSPGRVERAWQVWDVNHVAIEASIGRDGDSVEFAVPVAGLYQVELGLGPDSGCSVAHHDFTVLAPGAARARWWLQVVFPERSGLPPHEESRWIPSASLVNIRVPEAPLVDLAVVDAAGAPVAATVRWLRVPGDGRPYGVPVEAGTSDAGRVRVRLRDDDDYQVLIVPRCADGEPCALPPTGYRSWSVGNDLVVVSGQEIAGTVIGPGGDPLAGARVALTVDGVPSTVATTSAAGAFTVRTSRLGRARVVIAPAGGGLPRLETTLPDLVAGEPLAVRYAPLATRALTGAAIRLGGQAYAAARLTVLADIAVAGTVTHGATRADAHGQFIASQATGPDRALLPLVVPAVPASIVLEPVLHQATVVEVDLAATAPTVFDALPPATLRGRVSNPDGGDAGVVHVRAVPTGALAAATGMAEGKATAMDGAFALTVARGGTYELVASDPGARYAEARRLVGGDDGTVPDLALAAAVNVDGTVDAAGASAAMVRGASIALRCLQCTGPEASRAVAVARVTSGGRFRLVAPDPGAAP